jgi:hypothetical protein
MFKPFKNPIQTKIENQGLYLIVQSLNYVKLSIILSSPVNGNLMYSLMLFLFPSRSAPTEKFAPETGSVREPEQGRAMDSVHVIRVS